MSKARLELLDLYRGVCVLGVMLFHYTARLPVDYLGYSGDPYPVFFGYLGVNFFFAISGFCIYLTVESSKDAVSFLGKRFSRIYPAYLVCLLVTFSVVLAFGLPGREPTVGMLFGNFFFLNDLGVRWVDGVYWSLLVEIKYYVLFSVFFYYVANFGYEKFVVFCAVLMAVKKTLLVLQLGFALAVLERVLIVSHLPWFLLGASSYLLYRKGSRSMALFLCAVLLMVVDVLMFSSSDVAEKAIAAFVIGAAMVVVGICPRVSIPYWMRWLGVVSFPLYLLHQYVGFVFIRSLSGIFESDWLKIVLACALMAVLAQVVHSLFEFRYRDFFERKFLSAIRVFSR